jgi:formylglycine-generating enzyme required for sulfatase activity
MGSLASEVGRFGNETSHSVTLSKPFYAGKFEVTQGQWRAVMGSNRSALNTDLAPVESVSWDDVQLFLDKLCVFEGVPAGTFGLLTEAEWEWACRAGTHAEIYGPLEAVAWFSGNSGTTTRIVGMKLPNAFGLYDMIGNVWEWCSNWYGEYPSGSVVDPMGPTQGSHRVIRGGGRDDRARYCRSANRDWSWPESRSGLFRGNHRGFRLSLRPVPGK